MCLDSGVGNKVAVSVAVMVLAATGCSQRSAPERTSTSEDAIMTCVTLQAAGDALISETPMNQNFGALPILRVGGQDESLVRFDLGGIPAAAAVTTATLKLYVSGSGSTAAVNAYRATASWSEDSVTFASFGQHFDPAVLAGFSTTAANVQKSLDLTPQVRSWLAGSQPNEGLLLATSSGKKTILVSREGGTAAQRPQLQVCYTLPDDHCSPNPCQNGASCTNSASGFTCACTPGFTGTTCDSLVDNCAGNPCQHGGTCASSLDGYSCACPLGYTGTNCESLIDHCTPGACQNGGTCVNALDGYTCQCAPGYTGASCEMQIDNCASKPCQNGGTCANGVDGYTCRCATGFTGANCETNIDECASNPCHNGGTCLDGVASFTCSCAPGWGGPSCDDLLDTCVEQPCLHGGTCTSGVGTYSCGCTPGYSGTNCEIDINDCASAPCQNGGVCVDGVASYTCQCPTGVFGTNCEITQQLVASGLTFQATQGVPLYNSNFYTNTAIATVTDALRNDYPRATIDWGDGTPTDTDGRADPNADLSAFSIYSESHHWYAAPGSYDVTITITSPLTGATAVVHSTALVAPQLVATGETIAFTQGVPVYDGSTSNTVEVATVADGLQGDVPYATIDWGDGSNLDEYVHSGPIDPLTWSVFTNTTHWYAATGTYDVTVTVTSFATNATAVVHSVALVGPQLAGSGMTFLATQRQPLRDSNTNTNTPIGTVTDARHYDDLRATIDWGDGTPLDTDGRGDPNPDGTYSVFGNSNHFYAATGAYDVTITVTSGNTGATTVFHSTAQVVAPTTLPGTTVTELATSNRDAQYGETVTVTATVTDLYANGPATTGTVKFVDGSTTLASAVAVDATGQARFASATLAPGLHIITASYSGAGTLQPSTSGFLFQVVEPAATQLAVTASANPGYVGVPIQLDAHVTSLGPTPDGLADVFEGTTRLAGPTPVVNGSVSFTVGPLALGTHALRVSYEGSSTTGASVTTINETIALAPTVTTLSADVNPAAPGQTVTFSVAVHSLGLPPDGQVRLRDGTTVIAGPVALSNGQATFATSTLSRGTHSITADYLGSTATATSWMTYVETIAPPPLTVDVHWGTSASSTTQTFSFIASHAATFTCTVYFDDQYWDGSQWIKVFGPATSTASCTSPVSYSNLPLLVPGTHSTFYRLYVRATDQWGQNTDGWTEFQQTR